MLTGQPLPARWLLRHSGRSHAPRRVATDRPEPAHATRTAPAGRACQRRSETTEESVPRTEKSRPPAPPHMPPAASCATRHTQISPPARYAPTGVHRPLRPGRRNAHASLPACPKHCTNQDRPHTASAQRQPCAAVPHHTPTPGQHAPCAMILSRARCMRLRCNCSTWNNCRLRVHRVKPHRRPQRATEAPRRNVPRGTFRSRAWRGNSRLPLRAWTPSGPRR